MSTSEPGAGLLAVNDVPRSEPRFSGWLQPRCPCGRHAASQWPQSALLSQSTSPSCPWWLPLRVSSPASSLTASTSMQGAIGSPAQGANGRRKILSPICQDINKESTQRVHEPRHPKISPDTQGSLCQDKSRKAGLGRLQHQFQ